MDKKTLTKLRNNEIKTEKLMRERERLTSGGFVSHTEDGEGIGALDVEDVTVLRVGHVCVVVSRYLLQYLSRDRTRVCRRGAELRQYHRSPSHQRVKNRHPQLFDAPTTL